MELDTVNAYSTVGMEQGLSGDPWDCLFSDSISDAFQGRPEMLHMGIRRCDNTSQIGWLGPGLGFDFDDVLTEPDEDPLAMNDKSRSSNSNLEELNLDSDSELALTLDPNLILPCNMPIRSPATNSDAAMLETASVEENAIENEGDETENESEVERTENDEENESEEEEEIEVEDNEHNETEYETEEEETEEEEVEEDEETDDEEQDMTQKSLTPLNVEVPISSSSGNVGARTLTGANMAISSPTIQLTRLHPKISTISSTAKDIKMLQTNPGAQALQIRKHMSYNNNVHDVSTGATTTVMIQAAKREKELMSGNRDNSYPKPAYSYSCLIAMALKNSRTGSLPVSEIYNFMCRHFPYFTTAPTGWKNSVRHNLSLNKCFEKIEKPPGNGSQRKGCLWAIHPSKVAKMDEEVRKWSRKDPSAIKRAMVNPEQLEFLERGEMKYEGDKHDEAYDDAESYADSETGGSVVDETINDDENVTYDETKQIDIVDDDIVVEQLYEDLDLMNATELLDTRLNNFSRQEQPLVYEFVSCSKRQKMLTGNDFICQPVQRQDAASPRKKAHLVALRPGGTAPPGAESLLEAD
ncbi:FOXN4 protein, partial [Pseudoatta argentina]